ncbi:MAG TPA: hypothetical protein VNA89_11055 [Gemmatimonadaceae bacterium]|nr:hypothetical protein [Gemmatimonadaceae bacterium]
MSASPVRLGTWRRMLLLPLASLALAGCGDGGGPASDVLSATYILQTIGGDPVPSTVFEEDNYRIEVTAGRLTFNADRSWEASLDFRETGAGRVSEETVTGHGTYRRDGDALTLTDAHGVRTAGSLSGNTLLYSAQGFSSVWLRQ